MPGFARGLVMGTQAGATIYGVHRQREQDEIAKAQAAQVAQILSQASQASQAQAQDRNQALQLGKSMKAVASMPKGPTRTAQAEEIFMNLKNAGVEYVSPSLQAMLSKEDPEAASRAVNAINATIVDDPTMGMEKIKAILSDPQQSAKAVNRAYHQGNAAQVKSAPRKTEMQRNIERQNIRVQQIDRTIQKLSAVGGPAAEKAIAILEGQRKQQASVLDELMGRRTSALKGKDPGSLLTQIEEAENKLNDPSVPEWQKQQLNRRIVNLKTALARSGVKGGSSEFERLTNIPEEQRTAAEQSRIEVLSGLKARPPSSPFKPTDVAGKASVFDSRTGEYIVPKEAKLTGAELRNLRTVGQREKARVEKKTVAMRNEALKGMEHIRSMRTTINDALAAMDSGDTGLADTLLNQVMSQVQDTDVRAFQMYREFDRSFGNVIDRTMDSINRFIHGTRTDQQKDLLRNTLTNFRDNHVGPTVNRLRTQYRNLALEEDVDPFKVVPPESPEEIRDATMITREEKLRLLKIYFPEMFQ